MLILIASAETAAPGSANNEAARRKTRFKANREAIHRPILLSVTYRRRVGEKPLKSRVVDRRQTQYFSFKGWHPANLQAASCGTRFQGISRGAALIWPNECVPT